jgi:hypothetical protein
MTDAGGFDVLPGLAGHDGKTIRYEDLVHWEKIIDGEGFIIRAAALGDILTAKGARRLTQRPRGTA